MCRVYKAESTHFGEGLEPVACAPRLRRVDGYGKSQSRMYLVTMTHVGVGGVIVTVDSVESGGGSARGEGKQRGLKAEQL